MISERSFQRLVPLHREEMRQVARTGNRHLRPVLAGVFRNLRSRVTEILESQKDGPS